MSCLSWRRVLVCSQPTPHSPIDSQSDNMLTKPSLDNRRRTPRQSKDSKRPRPRQQRRARRLGHPSPVLRPLHHHHHLIPCAHRGQPHAQIILGHRALAPVPLGAVRHFVAHHDPLAVPHGRVRAGLGQRAVGKGGVPAGTGWHAHGHC